MSFLHADTRPEWCKTLPRAVYSTLERVMPDEPWFEVYRVSPGVYSIYEPKQFEEVISFLVVGTRRALLLDTGMGIASIRKVVEQLVSLPVTVLNTHTHPDHIGGNAEFRDVLALDRAYTRDNAKGYSTESVKEFVQPDHFCGELPAGFESKTYAIRPFQIAKFIKDGNEIDLGDRKLRVIETPGHTPDSLCLLDEQNRLLFTGDSFYPGPIYLFVKETDFAAYVRSVEKLAALANKVDWLLPAHNEPIASPTNLLKLRDAVRSIENGSAKPTMKEGLREYGFDGFSILVR